MRAKGQGRAHDHDAVLTWFERAAAQGLPAARAALKILPDLKAAICRREKLLQSADATGYKD
jgi:hypothetical protein